MKVGVALFSLVLAAPLIGCEEDAPPPLVRPVVTTKVQAIATETFGPFAGTVQPRYESQLGFQLAGRMVARDVYIGDSVRKGQRLAALDPTVTQFALLQAKADVADAKAQVENTEGIEQRQKTLASGGVTSQATLDNANAGLATAKARLDQAQAGLRKAQDQLGYTELRATFDAVIGSWQTEVGQYVDVGKTVVTLARPDVREVVVDIPDDLVGRLAPASIFDVTLQAAPSVTAKATVRELGPMADDSTRSHRVRMTLVDPSPAFRLGTTVSIVRETAAAPYMPVPADAVIEANGKPYVWLLAEDGHSVHRRNVIVSTTKDGVAHVAEGLKPDDEVVTVGVHSLSEGQAVAGSLAGLETGATSTELGARR